MKQYKNTLEIRDNRHSCAKLKTYHFSGEENNKWDYKHLRKLSDEELSELHEDVEGLRATYPHTRGMDFDAKVALDREQSK